MIFVLMRTVVWGTLFVGVVLWAVPAQVLAAAGIRAPASFGVSQAVGIGLGLVGLAVAAACVATFVFVGKGTPAPFDPPRRLVVRGPYRPVRNPIALAFLVVVHSFVVLYEEPTLRRTFGRDYVEYCQRVGRWWPRARRGDVHA